MRDKFKRAFTLVELVVVIAVVAILSAVAVGSYFGVVVNANKSADETTLKQANDILKNHVVMDGAKNTSIFEALEDLESDGLSEDTLVTKTEGSFFYWDKVNDQLGLGNTSTKINDYDNVAILNNTALFDTDFDSSIKCSIYLSLDDLTKDVIYKNFTYNSNTNTLTLNEAANIDTSNFSSNLNLIINDKYSDGEESIVKEIIVKTSQSQNITCDFSKGTVYHYGDANNIIITAIASECWHEFGTVESISLTEGHIYLEESSLIRSGSIEILSNNVGIHNKDYTYSLSVEIGGDCTLSTLEALKGIIKDKTENVTFKGKAVDKTKEELNSLPSWAVCYIDSENTITPYDSLENALDACNNSKTSTTSETIVMIPGDSTTIYTYSGTHTLGSNDTLILPYDSNENYHEEVKDTSSTFADNNASSYRKCRLELGVDENGKEVDAILNINSGAKVYIGGKRRGQGYTAEDYAEIYMSDKASINNYGTIYSYGFIKENTDNKSSINCKSGSSIYLPMVIYDWGSAGAALAKENNDAFVSNRYDFPNVRPTINAVYGSNIVGMVYTYGSSAGQIIEEAKVFSTNDAMFLATGSNAFLSFNFYDSNTSLTKSDTAHKSKIIASGNFELSHIAITVKYSIISYTIDSADFYLPIPGNFDISFDNGTLSLPNKIKFLPGSTVTLGKSGTCIMNNNVVFYQSNSYTNSSGTTVTMPSSISTSAAKFINNGTLKINAKFSGFIQTSSSNSKIITGSNFAIVDDCYEVKTSGNGLNTTGTKIGPFAFDATGYIGSSTTNVSFSPLSYYVGKGTYWEKLGVNTYTISFTVNPNDDFNNYTDADFEYVLIANYQRSETQYKINNSNYYNPITLLEGTTYTITANTAAASISSTSGTANANDTISIKCNKGIKKYVINVNYTDLDNSSSNKTSEATYYVYLYKNESDIDSVGTVTLSKDSTIGYVYDGYYVEICKDNNGLEETIQMDSQTYSLNSRFKVTNSISIASTYNSSCIVEGTLISMADGSQKKVEEVKAGDTILSFNHFTGNFEPTKILGLINHGKSEYKVLNLYFEDGTNIGVVNEHLFLESESGKYIALNLDNVEKYVGKEFLKAENGKLIKSKLLSFEIKEEYTTSYSIISYENINAITDGYISATPSLSWAVNYFALDENYIVDKENYNSDLESYGEYSYEDWKDLISYDLYEGLNVRYFKVAIGKGLVTYEQLLKYIEYYSYLVKSGEWSK